MTMPAPAPPVHHHRLSNNFSHACSRDGCRLNPNDFDFAHSVLTDEYGANFSLDFLVFLQTCGSLRGELPLGLAAARSTHC